MHQVGGAGAWKYLACPSSLVCMLHTTIFEGRPPRWCRIAKKKACGATMHQLAAENGRFCAIRFCGFGQPFRQQWVASWGPKISRHLVPPGWLTTLAHQGWPMHPCCPLPCPLRQPPKSHPAQTAAQPAPAVTGTGAAAHGPPPGRNAAPR